VSIFWQIEELCYVHRHNPHMSEISGTQLKVDDKPTFYGCYYHPYFLVKVWILRKHVFLGKHVHWTINIFYERVQGLCVYVGFCVETNGSAFELNLSSAIV
jgi:hypothetical protein